MMDIATIMGAKSSRRGITEKGRSPAPFLFQRWTEAYCTALSVIAAVQAPVGSVVMIFWASSASAVRL